ncbi:MAG: BirA family biotin operon repressor/biotin-[acetyl-CoA-carboxylase] ligase [Planctomycetota bacterium]|jgi:BirA family biotin operon repressor/biotin-[acetyl-CoA-carboxylase] ligase
MTPDEKLESVLKRQTRFAELVHVVSCDSTQDLAAQEPTDASSTSGDGVFWADHQTQGRGRQQRIWDDKAGLDLAVTLRVTTKLDNPLALPAALPVAVLQACEPIAGQQLRIKWPNDVYAQDRKLSGVLIDRDTARPDTYRIGIGINVNRTNFDGALADTATSLSMLSGEQQDRHALVLALATHADAMVAAIERGDLREHVDLFRERLGLLGERVEVQARETMVGTLTSIDFGNLVLDERVAVPLAIVRSLLRAP